MYGNRSSEVSINFVTCHDGFTMYDLVSYNEKHNEDNGEDNRDGANDNNSWNCGTEGMTDDPEIQALRLRQMKNMYTILLTSRGVPMLLSGDEFANTQYGNNNAYCQDSDISYLDWSSLQKNKPLWEYVRELIRLRKAHPVLRDSGYNFGHNGTGYPELSFHGLHPWDLNESEASLTFAYMYAEDNEKYKTDQASFIYVAVNAHWEEHEYELPIIPEHMRWHIALRSDSTDEEKTCSEVNSLRLSPRSTAVLIAY